MFTIFIFTSLQTIKQLKNQLEDARFNCWGEKKASEINNWYHINLHVFIFDSAFKLTICYWLSRHA